jgi:hypothetical protein
MCHMQLADIENSMDKSTHRVSSRSKLSSKPRPLLVRLLSPPTLAPMHSTSHHHPTSPRSSSRSERLLRDTLRRDELAVRPRRRHSHVPSPSVNHLQNLVDHVSGSSSFRSNPPTYTPHHHVSLPPSSSSSVHMESQFFPTRSASPSTYYSHRQPSPSPSRPKHRKRASLPAGSGSGMASPRHQEEEGEPLPMTPHELALRARLERVLGAPSGASVRRERRSSNEVRDEEGSCPWRERDSVSF